MSLYDVISNFLLEDAELAAIVGNRIWPDFNDIPEQRGTTIDPYVIVQKQSQQSDSGITSELWKTSTYSFYCVSTDSAQKVAIAEAVEARLTLLNKRHGDVWIMDSSSSNSRDEVDEQVIIDGLRPQTVYWDFMWRPA